MKKCHSKNSGFTLVELLVVIIIVGILLGIGIAAVMHLIDRSKQEQVKRQEQLLALAAEDYLQENRSLLPKSVGESTIIPIDVLRSNNYITEDLVNEKNESCMIKSFVKASKKSSSNYTYKAYIYCGDDEVDNDVVATIPTIAIDFVDANGVSLKNDSSILQSVSEARFIIDFDGGKNGENDVAIEGYSYSISTEVEGETSKEVYSSGTISANGVSTIHVERGLVDYIDITKATKVVIRATVRNVEGGVSNVEQSLGESGNKAYKDTKLPSCGRIIGAASGTNDWITRTSSTQERKISVTCSDGSGSGCIRSTFTKTWSGNVEEETGVIRIKDNAGNPQDCEVLVNIDKKYPVIKIDAYAKGKADDSIIGDKVISQTKTTNSSGQGQIVDSEYANLEAGYISRGSYPYGVIYKVTLSDLALGSWKWEVNENEINTMDDPDRYENVSVSNAEGKSGNCNNKKSCEINITLVENGLRKGVLTVNDKHGNQSIFTIYAKIDRSAPGAPTIVNSSNGKSNGDWTSDNVTLTLSSSLAQSKIGYYYYTYNENALPTNRNGVNDSDANTKWVAFSDSYGMKTYTTPPWRENMNKSVYVMVCDIAGNCSESSVTDVKIDKNAPTGLVVTGYKKKSQENLTSLPSNLETINSGVWHNGWVLVIPSGATDTGSGEVHYILTVTGASASEADSDEYEQRYRNVNKEGKSVVSYKACDAAGNCTSTIDFAVWLDRTAPTIPEVIKTPGDEWTKENVVLTIGNSADSGSKIGKYYYTYASSPTENGSNPANSWVEIPEGRNKNNDTFTKTWDSDTNRNVKIKVCDKVDNCKTTSGIFVGIDRTAPAVPVITTVDNQPYVAHWTNTNFSLVLKSNDGGGSGLDDCQYTYSSNASSVGDDADTQWKHNNGTFSEAKTKFTTTEFSAERNQNVYLRVCDKLGNCSQSKAAKIMIDKKAPSCGTMQITGENSDSGIAGSIACSDVNSNGVKSECVSDVVNFEGLIANTDVEITDNAGNSKLCPVSVYTYSCPFGPWIADSYKNANRNTCGDSGGNYIYSSGSCLTSANYHTDICTSRCKRGCGSTPLDICSNIVCCIKKEVKPCYTSSPIYSDGTINNGYFGIVKDENNLEAVVDNIVGINNAIKYASENNITNIKLEQGTYYVDVDDGDLNKTGSSKDFYNQNIKVLSNINFNLNGSTIIAVANNRAKYKVINVYGESNVKIYNGSIKGDKLSHDFSSLSTSNTHEYGMGVAVLGNSNNITIQNLNISELTGDGIYVKLSEVSSTNNITIKNNEISSARRNGISIVSCNKVSILNNVIYGTNGVSVDPDGGRIRPGSGIDLEPNSTGQSISHITISGNQIYSNSYKRAVLIQKDVSDLEITNNQLGDQIVVNNGLDCYSGLTIEQIKSQKNISITSNTVKSGVTAYVTSSNVNNLFTITENNAVNQ